MLINVVMEIGSWLDLSHIAVSALIPFVTHIRYTTTVVYYNKNENTVNNWYQLSLAASRRQVMRVMRIKCDRKCMVLLNYIKSYARSAVH